MPGFESLSTALPAVTISRLYAPRHRSTGIELVAYLSPKVHQRLARLLRRTGRNASNPIMWLTESALRDDLIAGIPKGSRVEDSGHKGPRMLFWAAPSWYKQFVDLAWELEVYQDSARHLLGICIERQLARKPDKYWLARLRQADDIVDRLFRAIND